MIKVLFVCLGNICRSPMAHFVFKDLIKQEGCSSLFEIESAGTEKFNALCKAGIHAGTKEIFKRMNIPFEEHIARHFQAQDYEEYDYILKGTNLSEEFMNKPLTVTLHIGDKQIDKLTDEQCEKMAQRLSETMSRFYSQHITEFTKLKD